MRNLLTLLLLCSSLPSLGAQYARDLRVETPLMLRELGASPAGLTGYGQLYTKTLDNDLYFMDSLGNQFNVLLGGAAGAQLNDLSDVDTFTASPTAGQFLKFNGSLWVPGDIPIINALDDIGDVNVASATEGQVLTRVGTEWQAKDASGASDHNSLTSLQGGTTGEYYHLTAAEDTAVASLSGTTTNYVLKRSATGFANSVIFDNGSFIGIGITTPSARLEVNGNSGYGFPATTGTTTVGVSIRARSAGSVSVLDIGGNLTNGSWLQTNNALDLSTHYPLLINPVGGNVGIGNTAPTTALDVTGDITTSGYVYFGNSTTDGSFRMTVSGGDLVVQKRISGVWTQVASFDEN